MKITSGVSFFFSSRRRHTRWNCDWSSDVCSSDLRALVDVTGEVLLRHRRLNRGPLTRLASKGLSARRRGGAQEDRHDLGLHPALQRPAGRPARPRGDELLVGSKSGSKGEHPGRTTNTAPKENPPFAAGFLYGASRARTGDLLGAIQNLGNPARSP